MKVIFLDLDGGLNSLRYFEDIAGEPRTMLAVPAGEVQQFTEIDPSAVARLNRIVAASGAHIVLSTTWRALFPLDVLQGALATRGFVGRVIGTTPAQPLHR